MSHLSRKEFLQKACAFGICMGGLNAVGMTNEYSDCKVLDDVNDNDSRKIHHAWVASLLSSLDANLSQDRIKSILKSCAEAHYEHLSMDMLLKPYVGNIESFIDFLEKTWGWRISYNKLARTIIANENKSYCVCPMIKTPNPIAYSTMCYCSEGFAEKMFSVVLELPVSASIISSVLRGDNCCIYRIEF